MQKSMNQFTPLASMAVILLAIFFMGDYAQANTFTVNSYELGGGITYERGGVTKTVHAAILDVTLEGYGDGYSFCVDLDHYIGTHNYDALILDPGTATTASRNYAGAAAIANYWTYTLGSLSGNRSDAVTGVQAAIWDVLYGNALTVTSLGAGAQKAYEQVMSLQYTDYGNTVLADFGRKQDQVFTPAIPEPSAALVFALGGLLIGTVARGKRR